LVVNDFTGSDSSTCLVFEIGKGAAGSEDVRGRLMQLASVAERIRANHHVFVRCVDWTGDRTVLVKLEGYGKADPKGFTEWFEYSLGGNVTKKELGERPAH
jgi:hypothetical protein